MMTSETLPLAYAFIGGVILGVFFFGGLWLTIRSINNADRPVWLLLSSFFGRTVIVLIGFVLIASGHWERILAASLAFLLSRMVLVRVLPFPTESKAEEGEPAWN